jgi:hypothetical protein
MHRKLSASSLTVALGCLIHTAACAAPTTTTLQHAPSMTASPSPAAVSTETPALTLDTVQVSARLDRARNALSPDTGTSQTVFDRKAIRQLPQGDNTPLNRVLLQAPGVVQDSF